MKCRQTKPDCVVWGLKNGGWYAQNIPVLRSLFPQAKFIHIVRDGRAVFASEKRAIHPVIGQPFQTDPIEAALGWKTLIANFDKSAKLEFALEVRYEDLLTESSQVIGRILSFLGVHADTTTIAEMLEPRRAFQIHEQYSHLHPNVGKPAQHARIAAWREELSPDEVSLFEKIAGRVLHSKGYSLLYPRSLWDDLYLLRYEGMQRVEALAREYLKMLVVKYADIKRVWA